MWSDANFGEAQQQQKVKKRGDSKYEILLHQK